MNPYQKNDIKGHISQLQTIIHLQEQSRILFDNESQEKVVKNRDVVRLLRGTLREAKHELDVSLKYDHVTINRACWDKKFLRTTMSDYSMQEARELLSSYVFDRMNAHNVLLYEVKRRGSRLEDLQMRLEHLIQLGMADPRVQVQLQIIRQLENDIEKMQVKIAMAEKNNLLYLKMVDALRDEMSRFPFMLDHLEKQLEIYQGELKGIDILSVDMEKASNEAQKDMERTENVVYAAKASRDNMLASQKKLIERIHTKEATERLRRMQARREMNLDLPGLISREGVKGAKVDSSKAQLEYQNLVTSEVEKVKCAVQCSHLWDIAGRLMAQKMSEENLQQQIMESEKKRQELKDQLKELELIRAELKFHQSPSSLSLKKLKEDLQKNMEEEEERLKQVQSQVTKNQELILCFENGVDNLMLRLYGIKMPGQEDFEEDTGDVFDKLQLIETKLLYLVNKMKDLPSYDFSQEETNEDFVHVRNYLEDSTRDESQNLRITIPGEEDEVREAFNFADLDHSHVPNREEIKMQGLKLVENKTKVTKKKQRGGKK